MNIKYKINYLSDGNKVKITNELFNQIKQWDAEGIIITSEFLDELKIQDNNWINSMRRFYRNTVPIESLSYQVINQAKTLRIKNFQNDCNEKILLKCILSRLSQCTKTQRRRFVLHYYYDFSYEEIGNIEERSKITIRESVKKAVKMLTNNEQF